MTGCWQRGEGVMISHAAPWLDKAAPPVGRRLDSAHDVGRLSQADQHQDPPWWRGRCVYYVMYAGLKESRDKVRKKRTVPMSNPLTASVLFPLPSDIKTAMHTIICNYIMTLQDHILKNEVIHAPPDMTWAVTSDLGARLLPLPLPPWGTAPRTRPPRPARR